MVGVWENGSWNGNGKAVGWRGIEVEMDADVEWIEVIERDVAVVEVVVRGVSPSLRCQT
jgi:hypothetical protein